jgi:hypothetical protein
VQLIRIGFLGFAALCVVACDESPAGLHVSDVIGPYDLIAADGEQLPYTWAGGECTLTTESGTMTIFDSDAGLAYNLQVNTQYVCANGQRGLWPEQRGSGSVKLEGTTVLFRPAAGSVWTSGHLRGDTLLMEFSKPSPDLTFVPTR